ncbi:MAG: hypothetical protein VX498_16010 [Myxococcota bacterium]|nr:hypothetical protein [Myxococcota bacterium]
MSGVLRSLSGVERLWLTADLLSPPFVNQMVIEGQGAPGESGGLGSWRAALARLGEAHPGSRSRLVGTLGWSRWQDDGPGPRLVEVDGTDWDGRSGAGAPFLQGALDPRSGPTVELLVVRGPCPRLVLRTHHAVMDGRGTLCLAEDLFRILSGRSPVGSVAGPLTDQRIAEAAGRDPEVPPMLDMEPVLAGEGEAASGLSWSRVSIPSGGQSPLPALVAVLAGRCGRRCRFDIPIDLRRHEPELRSTANLTGLLRLSLQGDESPGAVADRLRQAVQDREESDFVLGAGRLTWLPLWLLRRAGSKASERSLDERLFGTVGTLSNLGRLTPSVFSSPDFAAQRIFFIPPGNPGLPLFLTLTGGPEGVELCASAPRRLIRNDELCQQLAEVGAALAAMG